MHEGVAQLKAHAMAHSIVGQAAQQFARATPQRRQASSCRRAEAANTTRGRRHVQAGRRAAAHGDGAAGINPPTLP
ncbi:hypothetical protein [Xanthomonas sp. WHRI 7945]|nr:hypothetical protein [Xanthomonas campestris pv. campestris]